MSCTLMACTAFPQSVQPAWARCSFERYMSLSTKALLNQHDICHPSMTEGRLQSDASGTEQLSGTAWKPDQRAKRLQGGKRRRYAEMTATASGWRGMDLSESASGVKLECRQRMDDEAFFVVQRSVQRNVYWLDTKLKMMYQ